MVRCSLARGSKERERSYAKLSREFNMRLNLILEFLQNTRKLFYTPKSYEAIIQSKG
jgi:hypothetical protein